MMVVLLISTSSLFGSEYISNKDQTLYRNDPTDGLNKRERIDSLVKELNKVLEEVKNMKADMAKLRQEMDELKAKK